MCYVGQTYTLRKAGKYLRSFGYQKRFQEHLSYTGTKKASMLGRAMETLGKEYFYVELLEECDIENIDDRERYWIDQLCTLYPQGYNVLYGAPYSHDPDVRKKISDSMKEFFKDPIVRGVYSDSHKNKFKEVNMDNIKNIEIHPIKEGGIDKIVYMYLIYNDDTKQRRRYGGVHESYEHAFVRCYNDAIQLCHTPEMIYVKTTRHDDVLREISPSDITKFYARIYKIKQYRLVAVFVHMNNGKKRYVFGGKTIDLKDAYTSALDFINKLKKDDTYVCIAEDLIAATHPNCGNPLTA
jgi:group I intron endonuclease